MKRLKLCEQILGSLLVVLFLVGCTSPTKKSTSDLVFTRHVEELVPTGVHLLTHSTDYSNLVSDPYGVIWTSSNVWSGGNGHIARLDPATGDIRVWDERDDEAFGNIKDLAPARQGGVWIIHEDSTLRWFDGERFRDVVEAPPMYVNAMVETTFGTLLVSNEYSGIFQWDGRTWNQIEDDRLVSGISDMAISTDGDLWVGNIEQLESPGEQDDTYYISKGVSRYDGERWETFTSEDAEVLAGTVEYIEPLSNGTVWVGTSRGVAHFDGESWHSFDTAEIGLGGEGLAVLVSVAPDGTVWAATNSKSHAEVMVRSDQVDLASYDGDAWSTFSPEDGLPEGDLDAVPLATEDDIFVGTEAGLYQLVADRWNKILPLSRSASSADIPIRSTTPFATVRGIKTSGGFLWAWGENEIWRYGKGEWSQYAAAPEDHLRDVAYISDTLIAATNPSLMYFDGDEWQELSVLIPNTVWRIAADEQSGILWMSAVEALYRWNGDENNNVGQPPSSGNFVGDIAVTGDGTVWAAGMNFYFLDLGGLARYDDTTGSWEMVRPWLADEDVPAVDLATTPNGSLWVLLGDFPDDSEELIDEEGNPNFKLALAYWDIASREWSIFEENLPDGDLFAIAADDQAVWLAGGGGFSGTFDGLFRFDGETWSHYSLGTGVEDVAVAPDGTIWYTEDYKLHQLR